jgi:two-component system, chemotaxis family, CheB/CheR fusion protein
LATHGALLLDVIIADYNLPGTLNGAELIAALRASLHRDIPAMILTGDISTDTLRKIADADCVHLSKPAGPETLIQQIQTLLAEKPKVKDLDAPPAAVSAGYVSGPIIFAVDDDGTTRDAMQELLEEHGHPVETYASAEAFLAADRPDRQGCLLIDALMPGMGGVALLERLKLENRGLPAIMITGQGDIAMAIQAMKAGAADFLEKPIRPDELLASIERALEGAQDTSRLSAWRQTAAERIAALTARQREVMDLVAQGRPNKLIAHALGLSQRTVENHRAAVMKRTGTASIPDLIRLVMAAGDLSPKPAIE